MQALAAEHGLDGVARERLLGLLERLADPQAPTTVTAPAQAVDAHLADSLVALQRPEVRAAARLADLGAGAGFPGLALAVARPEATVALVESVGRKAAFLRRTVEALGLANVEVHAERAEAWAPTSPVDLVTARALAPLDVVLEYAAPLLALGGHVVAWKGRRDADEEAAAAHAGALLGLEAIALERVAPFPAARDRHLHVWLKRSPTPARFPRRPGMARKRPLGGARSSGADRPEP